MFEIRLWNHWKLPEAFGCIRIRILDCDFTKHWFVWHVYAKEMYARDSISKVHSYVYGFFANLSNELQAMEKRYSHAHDYLPENNVYCIEIIAHNNITISAIYYMQHAMRGGKKKKTEHEQNVFVATECCVYLQHAMSHSISLCICTGSNNTVAIQWQ